MQFSRYNLQMIDTETKKPLIFNTLTGHSFYIGEDVQEALQRNDITLLSDKTKAEFRRCGIIIDDSEDERRYFAYFHNKAKFSSDNISSTVLLTWACNFACVYCYEGAGSRTATMDHECALRYIKFMKNEASNRRVKSMYINLFGGEPLMNIEIGLFILKELHEYCQTQNIHFSCGMITNGTLISEEIIAALLSHNCSMIQITLDGMEGTHNQRRPYKNGKGSFADVISAIQLLINYPQIKTVVRINVDRTNLEEAKSTLKYLGNQGKNLTQCSVDFGIVRGSTLACSAYSGNCLADDEIGDVLSHLWEIAESNGFVVYTRPSIRWMYCGLYSDSQFTITPDCSVYKCWEHAGIEKHKMGVIDSEGRISQVSFAYFDWMSKNPLEDSECRECIYLPACGGGCGVVSYNETNSYHHKGCFKVKGVLEKQIQRFVMEKGRSRHEQ